MQTLPLAQKVQEVADAYCRSKSDWIVIQLEAIFTKRTVAPQRKVSEQQMLGPSLGYGGAWASHLTPIRSRPGQLTFQTVRTERYEIERRSGRSGRRRWKHAMLADSGAGAVGERGLG